MEKAWQTLCAVALAAGSFLFGSPDGLLLTLLAFVLMDYATGLLAAVCARRVSSAVGFRGLLRKMLILAMVGMGHLLDTQLLHAQGLLRNAVIGFYLANEGLSILENAGRMGLPLPEKLRTVLVQLKTEKGKDEKRSTVPIWGNSAFHSSIRVSLTMGWIWWGWTAKPSTAPSTGWCCTPVGRTASITGRALVNM